MATQSQSTITQKGIIGRLKLIGQRFLDGLVRVPVIVDWLVRLTSELAILTLIVFGIYAAYSLLFGGEQGQNRIIQILDVMDRDWKAMVVIVAVLFYNPIRALLTRIEQWIVKVGPQGVEIQASQKGPSTVGPSQSQLQAPLSPRPTANDPTEGVK